MNSTTHVLGPEILDYFRFVKSSEASIISKFPKIWEQTSLLDILEIIAVIGTTSSPCNFISIKRNMNISDRTLERYLNYLQKHRHISFEVDPATGKATQVELSQSTVEIFRSALSVFAAALGE